MQETVAALKNGETLDEGVISDLETIMGRQDNVAAGIGEGTGLGEGVLRETEAQARVIRNAARHLTGEAQMGVSTSYAYDQRRTYNQQVTPTVKVERLYVRDEQDVRSLAIGIAQLTKRQQAAMGHGKVLGCHFNRYMLYCLLSTLLLPSKQEFVCQRGKHELA